MLSAIVLRKTTCQSHLDRNQKSEHPKIIASLVSTNLISGIIPNTESAESWMSFLKKLVFMITNNFWHLFASTDSILATDKRFHKMFILLYQIVKGLCYMVCLLLKPKLISAETNQK